ncbi:MAG TPA: 6-phosphogluconolactonase [Gaiellaceae bacterium]|jgi:6-phosphogluconolactonase
MTGSLPDLHVLDDPADRVADLLVEAARAGQSIVLTGGSAPGRAYELAAAREPDWSTSTVWWGDERCVPPGDDRSNYKLAHETLLSRLEKQPRELHRIRGELAPDEAARELDGSLDGVQLDFLLLGLGPDGHCASLFPGSPQLDVTDRRAVAGPAGLEPFVERVTMTLPVLQAAKRIVFIVTGDQKADAVALAFGGEISRKIPASLTRLSESVVAVYLDPAASAKLLP